MSIKHYTPGFKDEAMRQSDQSRSYSYPDECLSRGRDQIHQVSQDRIARLTPTAYQSAVVFLAADTSGHDLVIDGGLDAVANDQRALQQMPSTMLFRLANTSRWPSP